MTILNALLAEKQLRRLTTFVLHAGIKPSLRTSFGLAGLLGLMATVLIPIASQATVETTETTAAQAAPAANASPGTTPGATPSNAPLALQFVPNQGQWPDELRYMTRAADLDALFMATQIELRLRDGHQPARLRLRPLAVNEAVELRAGPQRPTQINIFRGKDPDQWRTGIPSYESLRYVSLYPDIDLAFRTQERQLAYDFIVHPGADPNQILVAVEGAQALTLDDDGSLRVILPDGRSFQQQPPFIFQEQEGERQPVSGRFRLLAANATEDAAPVYGFEIDAYDSNRTLTIDPTLQYSSFVGGSSDDEVSAMHVNSDGTVIVAGTTASTDFADLDAETDPGAAGVGDSPLGSNDGFLYEMNGAGSALTFVALIGGSDDEALHGLAVDTEGKIYVAGATESDNFPVSGDAPFPFLSGRQDAFVAKLNNTASTIEFSTYFGGSNGDTAAYAVAVDADDTDGDSTDDTFRIYIAGVTTANDLRVRDAYNAFINGGEDAFIARFDPANTPTDAKLEYATYFGGSSDDRIEQLAILEPAGDPLFAGVTESSERDFPVKNALQPSIGGGQDIFIGRIARGGQELIFSTYLGGSDDEVLTDLHVDSNSHYLISGYTESEDWPTTEYSFTEAFPAGGDQAGIIAKIDKTGRFLHFSSYIGGNGDDRAYTVAVEPDDLSTDQDESSGIYIAGSTNSTLFPILNPYQANLAGEDDGFLTKIDPSGQTIQFSTYFGGSAFDQIIKLRTDPDIGDANNLYITGLTEDDGSRGFPGSTPPIYPIGGVNTFISHIEVDNSDTGDITRAKPSLWLDTDLRPIHPTGVVDGTTTWDDIKFSLNIDDRDAASERQVIGLTTTIYYDSTLLELTDNNSPFTWAGTIETDTDPRVNTENEGEIQLRIFQNETTSTIRPIIDIADNGKIADIHFKLVDDLPDSQQVLVRIQERGSAAVEGDLDNIDLDDIIYGVPGARYIERRCGLLGDCDCSGQVQVFEVQTAVRYALDTADVPICLTSDYTQANQAGELGVSGDLEKVIRNYVEANTESSPLSRSSPTPTESHSSYTLPRALRQVVGRLDFANPRASGNQVSYDLTLTTANAPSVLVADLQYPPSQVAALSLATGSAASGARKQAELNVVEPGWARIVIYGINANTMTNGVVANLNVRLAAGQSPQALDLELHAEVSTSRVRDGRLATNQVADGQPTEAAADQQLSVSADQGGTVISSPAGINCGATCSALFPQGQLVTLRATASTGYAFGGWSGACYGQRDCQVSMMQARQVTARFQRTSTTSYDLSVTKTGRGSITSDPDGVDCGSDCSQSYADGTNVTLTATPETGYSFSGWGGDCSGSDFCEIEMTQDKAITANFSQLNPNEHSLTVRTNGDGRVSSQPEGINCGNDCTEGYPDGATVTLTATPATGAIFFGWSGACAEAGACEVEMTAARQVTATFSQVDDDCPHDESLSLTGRTVSSSQAFRACRSITTGAGFSVTASGQALLQAGERILLQPGLRVQASGELRISLSSPQ
ncbi:InlB B-repeat-containing protein [Lamprobacter modestohalophilus]|uniref:DUF7948 domain-containing protein n=1 Tax=Lamprobacter modestohalophilus TaxID=1064514 RepID=UPI002ADED7FA|nr:InlB B-repeat-containing protein [Lamprobacter modestohalophilus]MEA1050407.1 InlB B-repeat-containing protein [Lamprobacter modestohalophilus]